MSNNTHFKGRTIARLMAVQMLYQLRMNGQKDQQESLGEEIAEEIIAEYLTFRDLAQLKDLMKEGQDFAQEQDFHAVDKDFFTILVNGILQSKKPLEGVLKDYLISQGKNRDPEPLMRAILLMGLHEIKNHQDLDIAVIISDYLDITHAFFDQNEAKFVNGVLDSLKSLRN